MEKEPKFVAINVTPAAREALRQAAIQLTSPVGRRVTMSEVLIAALEEADQDRLIARLCKQSDRR